MNLYVESAAVITTQYKNTNNYNRPWNRFQRVNLNWGN